MMRRIGAALLFFALICLSACGGTQEGPEKSIQDIYDSLSQVNDIANPREIDDFAMENTFGIDCGELVEEYVGTVSNTMSDSGLNLVIRAKDGKAGAVKTALQTYQAGQQTFFSGYYAEFADALANVSDGRIVSGGNVVILVFANTEGADYNEIDGVISGLSK